MFILRFLWAVLTSRWLWTLIGLTLLSLVIWVFGPIVRVGAYEPFASETVRIVIIALLVIFWLIWLIVAQRRAIRANRMFVAEIAAPVAEKPLEPRRRERRRRRRQVRGRDGRTEASQARRTQVPARDALVCDRRAAGHRQDHGVAPVRAQFSDRPDRRSAGRRRHAQLRLVLLRERGADRHRRPLCPAGEPARRRRRRMAGLPRPSEEASRPPRAERRDRRAVDRRACRRATKPSRHMAARSAGGWPSSTSGSKSAFRSI